MTRTSLFLRPVCVAALTASFVSGCASIQQAVDKVRGDDEAVVEPARPAEAPPATAPEAPVSKPVQRTRQSAPEPVRPAPAPAPAPAPIPPEPSAIPGPAWLKKCLSVQFAGGIVRCDADMLLAKPSPTVQVFTRDPKRVVDGQIRLRTGLPRIYRFYVVP